ncbi:TonB-dependent receptor [Acetobacter thailandicus]|uniref:TonB-dependent receptor n=1 Tax=Acetobacter thailandicus TaxID=1502842 RepID=UPI001BA75946|nr:TonB-dependent siderophore receptor [Acetobacter thailandicus]MBS0961013.1 TonB-dependent siderophore receptor [Acetobacter thailandicus]
MTHRHLYHSARSTPLMAGFALFCSALHTGNSDAAMTTDHVTKSKHRHTKAYKSVPQSSVVPDTASSQELVHAQPINGPLAQGMHPAHYADEAITVHGSSMNILREDIGLSRMPQDVMHTPQTVNVVPRVLMEQQNVKSLDEALRNVPGITASVGEGEGGMSGDQFLIRGFQAQNDIYENGLRDFGVYTRDSFYYDHVSVIKGPSSEVFGNGTTGGAINIVTKAPHKKDSYQANFSGGSGSYYRGTLDINKQISDSIAVRLSAMGNENNMVGRNYIYSHRWGIAPSVTFGLNKKISYTVDYFHQNDNRIPDYGVWVVQKPGTKIAKPITEYGINRKNWYGTTFDQDDVSTDMLSGRLTAKIKPWLTLYNDTKGGIYHRYYSASQPNCNATCVSKYFSGDTSAAIVRNGGLGGPNPYRQSDWSIQNVFSGIARFNTGGIRHEVIGGFDIEHVEDHRKNYPYNETRQGTNLINPSMNVPGLERVSCAENPGGLASIPNGVGRKCYKDGSATDIGVFLSDQIWLAKWFAIKGGFRLDQWYSSYSATGGVKTTPDSHFRQTQTTVNPTVSMMYTPDDNLMVYFNWSESTTPTSLYVTNSNAPFITGSGYSPERSRLYEVGAKYNAFKGRMGFTAALFRLEKNNSTITDPSTGDVSASSDSQRNQGLELSASGNITANWSIIGTYALYDSRVTGSETAADVGKRIQFVPKNSATLWTSYNIAPRTPYNLSIGGGVTWRQAVWLDAANTARVPATLDFDAMIAHKFGEHWRIAMNGYNLANRLNYSSLFQNRVTPAIGRSFLFNLSVSY